MINLEKIKHEIHEMLEKGCMSSDCISNLVMLYYLQEQMKREMDHHANGEHYHENGHKMDRKTAEHWVHEMGEAYTKEQTNTVLHNKHLSVDPVEFWAVVNAMKSDYPKLAAKYGVDHIDFYADMAVEWLEDRDAKPGKAMNYYKNVVKHG